MLFLEVERLTCSLHAGRSLAGRGQTRKILRDVTFSLQRGECFGLVGPSGSGKSTIARCVVGLIEPDGGTMKFAGETLWPLKKRRLPDPRIQLVFQASGLSLDPKMRIRRTIEEGFVPRRGSLTQEQTEKRIEELLEAVDLPKNVLDRYPHELSGGQRQRVSLMRSLASDASLLILDEPTAALDPVTQSNVLSLLRSLRRQMELTLIYISHDRETVRSLCDRIGSVKEGTLHA